MNKTKYGVQLLLLGKQQFARIASKEEAAINCHRQFSPVVGFPAGLGWPGQPGQGCRPWRRLRLWRVATVIARVAEIEM